MENMKLENEMSHTKDIAPIEEYTTTEERARDAATSLVLARRTRRYTIPATQQPTWLASKLKVQNKPPKCCVLPWNIMKKVKGKLENLFGFKFQVLVISSPSDPSRQLAPCSPP